MKINERIDMLRRQSKLTGHDVAEKLGISYSTYRRIERGIIRPDLEKLRKLAEIFHVGLDVFTKSAGAYNATNAQDTQVREARLEWGKGMEAKKSGRIKPVRLILEIDPDYEPETLPRFLQELEEMLERYSSGPSEK